MTISNLKSDHVHPCLEPSGRFLLGRTKDWQDCPGPPWPGPVSPQPHLTLSAHLQPQSPCPPFTSSDTSNSLPPLCSAHAVPPAQYTFPSILFTWLTSISGKMEIIYSVTRTPAIGIKLSFNPYSFTHQLYDAKLNKLFRSPSWSFLTYILTWARSSQIIHVKH